MKNTLITILVIVVVILGAYLFINKVPGDTNLNPNTGDNTNNQIPNATTTVENKAETIIGKSVEGRDITAYHFGKGQTEILFVGGIHGGYSWNTALVAYDLINYLKENPDLIPANEKITVIPVLNPDGLNKVVGTTTDQFIIKDITTSADKLAAGRFNANEVDLNRNFDCDWQTSGKWQNETVSGGNEVFSEPESQAIKNYIEKNPPRAVVVWYSAAGGVFSSSCHNGILEETTAITDVYATASGYKSYKKFDFYTITGDMVNWLAKKNISAISVLLTNHTDTEWSKNKAGIDALIKYYTE